MAGKSETPGRGDGMGAAVDIDKLRRSAKPISEASNIWVGQSPEALSPGILYESVETFHATDLLGSELIVTGYSLRAGDKGEFAVICCIPPSRKVSVFTTGSGPVLRKLKQAGEAGLLPVIGTLVEAKGKRGLRYFDFVTSVSGGK